ncbi:MAG: tRNA (adenosine(37)-N6)-threonylcarbamoyltransferase complex ATPase subunit type 1 TsaE [Chitinophagaceae bacterium]
MNITYTLVDVEKLAREVWQTFPDSTVWALHGDMGVGKTTFVRALCQSVLQSSDNVSSPTFALINQYESPKVGTISHIDLYRLGGADEAISAGVQDAMDSAQLTLVEWPEIAPELLPDDTLHLYFSLQPDNARNIEARLS